MQVAVEEGLMQVAAEVGLSRRQWAAGEGLNRWQWEKG